MEQTFFKRVNKNPNCTHPPNNLLFKYTVNIFQLININYLVE